MFSVFVHTDCNKRGQTSRSYVRAQIQTSRNFESNICNCNNSLGCVQCRFNNVLLELPYYPKV